jgi:hypothetical protein
MEWRRPLSCSFNADNNSASTNDDHPPLRRSRQANHAANSNTGGSAKSHTECRK